MEGELNSDFVVDNLWPSVGNHRLDVCYLSWYAKILHFISTLFFFNRIFKVYPNGYKEDNIGYVSVFIIHPHQQEDARVDIEIFISSPDWEKKIICEY